MKTSSGAGPLFFSMVLFANAALTFDASAQTIAVSISCGTHGDVSPKGVLVLPAHSDLTITAAPEEGYQIHDWYVDGKPGGWDVNIVQFHFGDLNVAVNVTFDRITNLVHVGAMAYGQVSPEGNLPVPWGDSVLFTATPDSHYHANAWKVDGITAQTGGTSYTLPNIRAEHWLTVEFAPDVYVVQATAKGNGSLSPTGMISAVYGDDLNFTATPARGNDVVVWALDGVSVLTNELRFALATIERSHSLEVTFGAPRLSIELRPANAVRVAWPTAMTTYQLQQNTNFNPAGWENVLLAPQENGGRQEVTLSRASAQKFFRLFQP